MIKITFVGAGSTVFARNVIGDCILTPELGDFEVCLFDIDPKRLDDSYQILTNINATAQGKAHIHQTLDKEVAFRGADFVVNAIQVGLYDPCTITDFEVPKKYGLRQTIADTLGIGGIFRALRTIPVMKAYADDMERLCPNAIFLNYTNPMAMLSGYMHRFTNIRTVGLCPFCSVLRQRTSGYFGHGRVQRQNALGDRRHQSPGLAVEDRGLKRQRPVS